MEMIERFAFVFAVNAVWQVALIAGIAALFDRALRRAPASYRHVLWTAAILLAAILPFASFAFSTSKDRTQTESQAVTAPAPNVAATALDPWGWIGEKLPEQGAVAEAGSLAARVAGLLLLGVVAWRAFRLAQAWRRTAAIHRSATSDAGGLRAIAARCREAIGVAEAPVLVSALIHAPATLGVFRPAVVLPMEMSDESSDEDLVVSIAHEMAHIRRRDFAVNLACEIVTLPIGWHPAAGYMKRMARATCEMACDELATRVLVPASDYARSLIRIAERLPLAARVDHTLGILDADILEERVMKLVGGGPRTTRVVAAMTISAAVIVLAASTAGSAVFGMRVQDTAASGAVDEFILGKWIVKATQDGSDLAKQNAQAEDMMSPELTLSMENGVLVGSVVFPKVIKDADGPKVIARDAVPVKNPSFKDGVFKFSVNNGEESLIGELKRTERGLEGRWISTKSKLSGTLTMTRAE